MHQGRMTAAAVEARLTDAGRVLLALPHAGCFPAGFRTLWLGVDGVPAERRWVPSPAEISAMDEAYRWVGVIDDVDERRLVLMRSLVWRDSGRHVWTWRRLCRMTGHHRDTLKTTWGRGIDRIARGVASDRAVWAGWGGVKSRSEAGFGLHLRAGGGLAARLPRKAPISAVL